MDKVINQMIANYDSITVRDKKNVIKEVIQEIVLCGLSRAGFFKEATFYGGTALRIFYGLDRFSEDLDFSLITQNKDFDLEKYLPILEKEVRSYGLNFSAEQKIKSHDSAIKSAFLKGNTKEHLLTFFDENTRSVGANEVIKVKLEVDIKPPEFATYENKYRLLPIPYQITLYDKPSLFAGKLHAVICRSWGTRIKGRDLYDYVFYLSENTSFNLKHLTERLRQTEYISHTDEPNLDNIKIMLKERFSKIDFAQATEDVLPFVKNRTKVEIWSAEFFSAITDNITCV